MKRRESERKNNTSTDLLPPEISLIALARSKGSAERWVFLSVCNGFNQSRSRHVQRGGKVVFFYF
jgi:hypothetical protein